MISKHRNRAFLQLAVAAALMAAFVILICTRARRVSDTWIIAFILLYLAAVTMWMVGSFTLAKAKGYEGDLACGVFVFLYVVGFCFPIAPLLFPGGVIFGLKDKARHRRRSHRAPI